MEGEVCASQGGNLRFKLALLISFGSGTLMYARRMTFISMIEEKPSATKDFRMEIGD